jgi:hypothetical protein
VELVDNIGGTVNASVQEKRAARATINRMEGDMRNLDGVEGKSQQGWIRRVVAA